MTRVLYIPLSLPVRHVEATLSRELKYRSVVSVKRGEFSLVIEHTEMTHEDKVELLERVDRELHEET